jgi:hypothetical protein
MNQSAVRKMIVPAAITHTQTHRQAHTRTHTNTHKHTQTHRQAHAHTLTYTQPNKHTLTHAHTNKHTQWWWWNKHVECGTCPKQIRRRGQITHTHTRSRLGLRWLMQQYIRMLFYESQTYHLTSHTIILAHTHTNIQVETNIKQKRAILQHVNWLTVRKFTQVVWCNK